MLKNILISGWSYFLREKKKLYISREKNINSTEPEKSGNDAEKSGKTEPQKPFDLVEALSDENVGAAKEDADAEQQRKEAMTERD